MIPISFLCRPLWAGLAVAAVSCSVSRGGIRTEQQQAAVSQRAEDVRSAAASSHVAGERFVCEETAAVFETVPAGYAATAVPLAALPSLPEGARFAARQGSLAVEARRCGDTLVIAARSDSLPRRVVRAVRTEIRRHCDSAAVRFSERRTAAADNIRQECRAETVPPPSRGGRWGYFLAGIAVCAAVFAGVRFCR